MTRVDLPISREMTTVINRRYGLIAASNNDASRAKRNRYLNNCRFFGAIGSTRFAVFWPRRTLNWLIIIFSFRGMVMNEIITSSGVG